MNEEYNLNLEFSRANLAEEEIKAAQTKVGDLPTPFFAKYSPDFEAIKKIG